MDTILDYLSYIVVAIAFYNIGSHVRAFQIMLNLSKNPDEFIKMVQKIKEINTEIETNDMPEDANLMELERVGDVLYAYDKHTGQFLAQATNLASLTEAIDKRFPGKKFFGTISADNSAKELVK
jgi:hypothetical protein